MSACHTARSVLLAVTLVLVLANLGCPRSQQSRPASDQVMAFVAHVPSNIVDAPPLRHTVFMSSGRVFQFDSRARELRTAQLAPAQVSALRAALLESRLASLRPANHYPPDGAHIVLGLANNAELRRYAWTGDVRGLERALTTNREFAEFVDAWTKTRGVLESAMPEAWSTTSEADSTIAGLLEEIREP